MQDIEPGKGRLIIECFGAAWSAYWGAMGSRTLAELVRMADADYIANGLTDGRVKAREAAYLMRIVKAVKESMQ